MWLWLVGGGIALYVLAKPSSVSASSKCMPCYDAKSAAYRGCMEIPASSRGLRDACFKAADDMLTVCLRNCQ